MITINKFLSGHSKWLLPVSIFMLFSSIQFNDIIAMEQFAYIANSNNKMVTIIDLENFSKSNLLLGFNPYYLNKIPGYDQLWIYRTGYYDSYLKVIDPVTGTLLYEDQFQSIQGVAVSTNGTQVFVAYETNPVQVKVLRTDDFSEIRNFVLVGVNDLQHFTLSNNGQFIYTSYSNNFYIIDSNNGDVIGAIPLNESVSDFVMSPDENYAFAFNSYWYLMKIDLNTSQVNSIRTNHRINALAISHNGQMLYVAGEYESKVYVYNAQSLTLISSFSIGSQTTKELKVSSDDIRLYVLNQNNPNFEVYECQTGTRLASIYTGSASYDFDFDYPPLDSIKPQSVNNVQVLNIYNDGAFLSWTAPSDDSLTERVRGYEVRYDTIAIADINQAKIYPHSLKPSSPGETDSLQITDLKEKTRYWVAIRSYDEAKNFSDSVVVEFTTLNAPQIAVSPDSFDISVSIGDTVKKSLTITNAGGIEAGALDFKIQMTASRDNMIQYAYVANATSQTISVIDLVNATQKLFTTEYNPYEVKKSPLTNELWIIDINKDILFILDLLTGKVKNTISFDNVTKLLFSADGTHAYLLCGNNQKWIKVYNTIDMTEVFSFQVSDNYSVSCFAISHNGDYIYIIDEYYLNVFNAHDGNKISSNQLNFYRAKFIEISHDDKYAYLCGENFLLQLDLQTFATKENSIGSQVSAFAISPDGEKLFIGFYYSSSVSIYNAATLTQASSVFVKNENVADLKVSSDGKYLYVLHQQSPNFEIYDVQTGNQVGSFTTGNNSYCFDISETTFPYMQIEPMSGTIRGGQSSQVNLTIFSQYLFHHIYTADLIITSNDPVNPTIKLPFKVNAQDTKGPDFNMSFFLNPYLTNYLKVLIFSHEFLPEFPTLMANDTTLSLAIQDSAYFIYLSNYKLTGSEDITFTLTGADSVGNVSTLQRQLRVENVPLGKASLLSNIQGTMTIKLTAESLDSDRLMLLWEEQDEESINLVYHVGPEFLSLKNSARLEIDYSNIKIGNANPHHLSLYQKNIEDGWEKLDSYVDKERKVILTNITRLGAFKIGYDETTFSEELASLPDKYGLQQNYPNPFNPRTMIAFTLPERQLVTLKIYDVLGREVETLIDGSQESGNYKVPFTAQDLASGIYFIHLEAGKFIATKKMILMK